MARGWEIALALLCACGRIGFDDREPAGEPLGEGWAWQLPLTLNNTGRAELVGFPLLVTFEPTRIDYQRLQADARDLRFVDVDDATLPYEIETWSSGGTSRVWVRVPRVAADSTTTRIYAAFGNPNASDGQQPARVWAAYAGVWHLAQAPDAAAQARDSSPNANHGTFRGDMTTANLVAGHVGAGVLFDGIDDYSDVADHPSLDLVTLTAEAWLNPTDTLTSGQIMSRDAIDADTTGAYNVRMSAGGNVSYHTNNLTGSQTRANACCAVVGKWEYFAFTIDASATASAYYNGVFTESIMLANPYALDTALLIARRGQPDAFYGGALDELRLASGVRTADWIAAQYASMTDAMITYGALEPR